VACLLISYDFLNDVHFNAWLEDPMGMSYNDFRFSYNRRVNRGSTNRVVRRIQRKALYNWLLSKVEPALPGDGRIRHSKMMPDGQTVLFGRDKVTFSNRMYLESDLEIVQLRGALDQLASISEGLDAELVVMLLPSKEELFAVPAGEASGNALELTMNLLDELGIKYLDLYGPLKSSAEQHTPYFQADIHFNAYGNEIVANTFLEWLLEDRLDYLAGKRTLDAR
jgi:hypothetical protein